MSTKTKHDKLNGHTNVTEVNYHKSGKNTQIKTTDNLRNGDVEIVTWNTNEDSRNGDSRNGDSRNGDSRNGDMTSRNGSGGFKDGHYEEDEEWNRQFLPPPLVLDDQERAKKVESVLSCLVLDGRALRRAADTFTRELEAGLRGEPSSLQMENTYVPDLPDGTEEGVFLALDLGGTNFRVLLLELQQGQLRRERVHHYHISDELRLGPGADLFNFLADCVQDFVQDEGLEGQDLSLGFTFSFPMRQHSISSGELITWTKSFNCSGMERCDVAALLQRCLRARGLRVHVRVLLNDTTGTLVAAAQQHPHVQIGAILGTGSNGCYVEAARACRWETPAGGAEGGAHEGRVLVDVEWGALGDNGCLDFLRTDIDRQVDRDSLLTGSFTFEKYIGGKYLGCLCRAALCALHEAGVFPAAPLPRALHAHHVSDFEAEQERGAHTATRAALRAMLPLDAPRPTPDDARVAQYACQLLSARAAMLVAVCISELLRRMRAADVVPRRGGGGAGGAVGVAVDGSVYKKHPRIRALMHKYITLLAPGHPFELLSAEDGSGKGSALTAAIAQRLAQPDS